MVRMLCTLFLGAAVYAVGLPPADARDEKKTETKAGVAAKVKSVDADKGTLTVTTADGKEHTYSVTADTTIVGPRGGVAHRRLHDPRFHEGMDVTVVASGSAAKELHLGFSRRGSGAVTAPGSGSAASKAKAVKEAAEKRGAGAKEMDEDEAEEFPGKVKSFDPAKHTLVVTLLNGEDRTFTLAEGATVTVKGTASKKGLEDPAVRPGAAVMVVMDAGGKKVKEVHVGPAAAKGKKAG